MWLIDFVVYGDPKSLKRHRSYKRGNYIGSYDPSQTDKADFLSLCMNNRPSKPFDKPLYLTVIFYFKRPKAHYVAGKTDRPLKQNVPLYHTGTPDVDNLLKFVCDALNGVFWRDDKYISLIRVLKMYSDRPRTRILIKELNDTSKETGNIYT
jgi:Holliday junction resolvase RusA-like endonuclease